MPRYTRAQLTQAWEQAGGDPNVADLAASVALAEQGADPQVANWDVDGYSYGPWQIHYVHIPALTANGLIKQPSDLLNLYTNAQAAVLISGNGQNWSPWSTCDLTKGCTAGAARNIYNNYVATNGGTQPDLSPGEQVMNSIEQDVTNLGKEGLNLLTGGASNAIGSAIGETMNIYENFGAFAVGVGLFLIGAFLLIFAFGEDISKALTTVAQKAGPAVAAVGAAVAE